MDPTSDVIPVLSDITAEVDEILRKYFNSANFTVSIKPDETPVTTADIHAQRVIISRLKNAFPKIPVIGEEQPEAKNKQVKKGLYFVIDPLDGTVNFAMHFPVFAVSIGLYDGNTPVAGVVSYPSGNELYTAVRGRGAYYNGTRITNTAPHRATSIADSTISGFVKHLEPDLIDKIIDNIIIKSHHYRSIGAAALEFCWLATGRIDGMVSAHLRMWDIAAGGLILEEAGGKWSRFDGLKPTFPTLESSRICSANTPELHRLMLREIQAP